MTDQKLIELLNGNPEKGMKALIDLYYPIVNAVVRKTLYSCRFCQADIDGCVAEVFSEFYLGLNRFSPSCGSIKALLCTIAKNNAVDLLRKSTNSPSAITEEGEIADDFSIESDFENKETRALIINAVKALGRPDSEIIIRKYFLAQSSKEIAKALRLSVSNVDTRTHRAIEKLKKALGGVLK